MNYLAHLLLGSSDDEMLFGSLLGDFMQGVELDDLPLRVRQGVNLHRAIDRFTDAHPDIRKARTWFEPRLRRHAGILLDVYFDHCLARDFSRFHARMDLERFAEDVYPRLLRHPPVPGSRLGSVLPHLVRDNWLVSYREPSSVDRMLHGIARRSRRSQILTEGGPALRTIAAQVETLFNAFFPQLVAHSVATHRTFPSSDSQG